jgi:zinc resistance-associated protein
MEESIMWKAIVAGTAALAIAGTTLVYAQQRGRMEGGQRWQPNTEDLRAFGEARLAALKAGLTLTPEQEKNWPAFEQAARELGKLRLDRMSAMRSAAPGSDPVERLRQRATALSDTGAALKKLADATDPLYKSLDENQKRRFAVLNRLAGQGREGREHHFRDRFGGREDDGGRWFHWGPRRTDDGSGQMEHPGAERL